METGFEPLPIEVVCGDRLIVRAHRQGRPERDAEILEVLGKHGSPPYRVRWMEDGRESLVYPGSDVYVHQLHGDRQPSAGRGGSR